MRTSVMGARLFALLLWLLVTQSALACSSGQCQSDCCTVDEFCGSAKVDCSQVRMGCHLPTVSDQVELVPPPEGWRVVFLEQVEAIPLPRVKTFFYSPTIPRPLEATKSPPPVPPPR